MRQTNCLLLVLLLFMTVGQTAFCQTDNDARAAKAELMIKYFIDDKPENLVAMFPAEVQSMVSPETLKGQFNLLVQQYGTLKSRDAWVQQEINGSECMVSVMHFSNADLAAVVPFSELTPLTMQIVPAAMVPVRAATKAKDEGKLPAGVIETTDTLHSNGVDLPMTICMSLMTRHAPVVVLVQGSGPLDRDETIYNVNRPFRDIAHQLAKHGITTVRYDKRTLVKGRNKGITLDEETVDDALAAIKYVRDKRLASGSKVFVLGHSLGAYAGPRIAQRDGNLSGIILLAAPARDMSEVVSDQLDYLLPPSTSKKDKEEGLKKVLSESLPDFRSYKPLPVAASLTIPMLIMQGEKDYQVTLKDFELWKKTLVAKPNVEFKLYPKVYHLFIETDAEGLAKPDDYMKKGNVATYVVNDIAAFVKGN